MEDVSKKGVISISNQIVVVYPKITMWSARKKLHLEDTKATAADMPPDEVISLGSKFVIDKAALADFKAIYRKAHAECYKFGTKFLGGYAVPVEVVPVLRARLDALSKWHGEALAEFGLTFDKSVQDWRIKHSEWIQAIGKYTLDKKTILEKFSFRVNYFKAEAPDLDDPLAETLVEEYRGLGGQLLAEIADEAADILTRTFKDQRGSDKEFASVRTVKRLRGLQQKMRGLAFLDPSIEPICNVIEHTLEKMPTEGKISGSDLMALTGMVQVMANPDRMRQYGQRVLGGESIEEVAYSARDRDTKTGNLFVDPQEPVVAQFVEAPMLNTEPAPVDKVSELPRFPVLKPSVGVMELAF